MEQEFNKALQYCLRYLGLRARSAHEMDMALQKKQFGRQAREQALAYCVQKKLLDDAAFTENLICYRQKGTIRGPLLLKQELQEKGIDPELIADGLETYYPAEREEEIVAAMMSDKLSRICAYQAGREANMQEMERKNKEKIFRYLLQKGFHYEAVNKVYHRVQAEKLDNPT